MRLVLQLLLSALGITTPTLRSDDTLITITSSGNVTHPWLDIERPMSDRIALLMSNMTLHDKFKMVEGAAGLENHGVGAAINPCIGLIKVSERLGIPNLCMGDGPSGVSNGLGNVTTFPAPIVVASSWDPDLMYDYAKAIAREHHDKGHNVALTPTINIQRAPLWGRNAESFSEDPFLTAELAVASVKGTQSENILASPKHFAAYNQETNRFGDAPKWSAANVIVSNRTLQEVYFPAFKAVVERARPGSIMTSYNKVNGYHASENKAILGDLFSWGFDDGFTVTDWYFGHRSTLESALAGQTMSMPGGKSDFGFDDFFSEKALSLVLRNGSLPQAVLDDMVRRVITPMFVHGLVDDHDLGDVNVDVRRQEHHDLSVKIVEEGTILLKNDDAVLPLSSNVKKIAVVGPGGDYGALVSERYGGFVGSPNLNETLVTPLQGIRHRAGQEVEVVFAQAIPALEAYEPIPDSAFVSAKGSALRTTVFNNSNWSGATLFEDQVRNISQAFALDLNLTAVSPISAVHEGKLTPQDTGYHDFAIYAGGYAKLFIDNEEVVWLRKQGFVNYATGQAHLSASVPVKFRIEYSSAPAITSKGLRIAWSTPRMKTTLLEEALVAVKDADVAVVFVGNILSEGGDGTSLALPTTEDDLVQAIAQVNPNVVVVAQTNNPFLMPWLDQVKTVLIQWYAGEGVGTALARILFGDINPSGKLAMTFPPSDSVGPCSLTKSFPGSEADLISDYADVFYDEDLLVGYKWYDEHSVEPLFPFGHGMSYTTIEIANQQVLGSRSDGTIEISLDLYNTGLREGKEVVQLYVGFPDSAGEPPKLLRGFKKVALEPGQITSVKFQLSTWRDLQYWSESEERWTFAPGNYTLYVGTSSRDISWSSSLYVDSP